MKALRDNLRFILIACGMAVAVTVWIVDRVDSKVLSSKAEIAAKIASDKADVLDRIEAIDARYSKRLDKFDDGFERLERLLRWRTRTERGGRTR